MRPVPSLERLREALEAQRAADPQTARKLARSLGGDAMLLAEAEAPLSANDYNLLLTALMAGARAHSYPQKYLLAQTKLMARRRQEAGDADPVVAHETARTIDVEMGALVLADPAQDLPGSFFEAGGRAFCASMNAGEFFTIALPGDGALKVRVRVVSDGPLEPNASEFRRLRGATPPAPVATGSHRLILHGGGKANISVDVEASPLVARGFVLGSGRSKQVLVLIGQEDDPEPLTESPRLELQ